MKKLTLLTTLTILLTGFSFGQKGSNGVKGLPSVGIHVGGLSYLGDIKGTEGATLFTYWRPAYGFYLEKKIGNIFGVSANGTFGKVSKSQLDDDVFLNFESSVMNFDLNLLFDFNNGKIINEESLFSPFVSVGFGYLLFDPKGDLKTDGLYYYHWDDATLRDVPQSFPGADTTSTILDRDNDYESALTDSTKNYAKNTFTIPIRFGLKFELSSRIEARMTAAYIMTFTDYIDNVAVGGNDNLFYTSFGLQYNFSSSDKESDQFKDFDFSDLDKMDSDGDGVVDTKDICQGTPDGVKVDGKGCALDDDKDGVPNYKDKEADTPIGTIVDKDGVTLSEEMLLSQGVLQDSVEVEYRKFVAEDLSQEDIEDIQRLYNETNQSNSSKEMPLNYKELDLDKDNYISAKEVTNAIDGFFEGTNSLTAKDLNELIDYYFDQ